MTKSTTASNNWHALLCQTLTNLRTRWPHNWPGLPRVLKACIAQLWPSSHTTTHNTVPMLNAAMAMAEQMESVARTATYEPHYHNRLHTADALVSCCLMLQALKAEGYAVVDDWAACLLLAVTSHDVLHPGGANSFVQEFEQQSMSLLRQIATEHGVATHWIDTASHLILHTDPTLVPANHDKVKGRAFVLDQDWAVVLMNEADILASATEAFGPQLSKELGTEWRVREHPMHRVVGSDTGRLQFLSSLRFSTPASMALSMRSEVAKQAAVLRQKSH